MSTEWSNIYSNQYGRNPDGSLTNSPWTIPGLNSSVKKLTRMAKKNDWYPCEYFDDIRRNGYLKSKGDKFAKVAVLEYVKQGYRVKIKRIPTNSITRYMWDATKFVEKTESWNKKFTFIPSDI